MHIVLHIKMIPECNKSNYTADQRLVKNMATEFADAEDNMDLVVDGHEQSYELGNGKEQHLPLLRLFLLTW